MSLATAAMRPFKGFRFKQILTRRVALWGGLTLVLLIVGGLASWIPYARENQQLVQALKYVEQGAIPDEPADYKAELQRDLDQPSAGVLPGVYSNLTHMDAVTYNAVLVLKPDGNYDYALSVGNDRVHKRYGHRGRWWVQGRVLHTVLLEGDSFLTAPQARNHVTPARERIVDDSVGQLTLQAHYGSAVKFLKVE